MKFPIFPFIKPTVYTGTDRADFIFGSFSDDTIEGLGGNDYLFASFGNDLVDAGAGDDMVFAGAGDDTVSLGDGNDRAFGGFGDDVIETGSGNDTVFGGKGTDRVIVGGSFDDYAITTHPKFAYKRIVLERETADGTETKRLHMVEEIAFDDFMLYLDGRNNAAYARDDAATTDEDTPLVIDSADLLANDSDWDGDTLTVVGVDATSAAGASVTISGGQITYTPGTIFDYLATGGSATDSFVYTVDDGKGGTDTATVTVTITGVNDAPELTGVTAIDFAENGIGAVGTYTATDVDDAALTFSLTGDDAALFSIDEAGVLTFDAAPDYEAPEDADGDNIYDVTIVAADDEGATDSLDVAVTVTDVAEVSLVVSEIMFNPASSEDDWEWVEIINTGTTDIDLAGWVFDDINSVAQSSANIAAGVVAAGESAILFNADDITAADFAAAWGEGINLIGVTGWGNAALNNGGDTLGLWSDFASYDGDNQTHANAVVSIAYDGSLDDGSGSIYLTDLGADANDFANWALSTDGVATPVNTGETAAAAGGNSGADIGSPGGVTPVGDVKLSEFQPNPEGADPSLVSVELTGNAGALFDGWLISVENDGANGLVDRAAQISGTFDANGILTVEIPDLENPSFTFFVTDSFTGSAGTTDIDADDDGIVDDLSAFGTIYDALGIPDATGDEATMYGAQLGGVDFTYTGDEPKLVFRDGTTGAWYAINDPAGTEAIALDGAKVAFDDFDTNPEAPTFGAVNPSVLSEPLSLVINEINADPDSTTGDANGDGTINSTQDEFVEIVNTGTTDADLSGLTLSDAVGVRHTFAEGTVLAAGQAIVVFGGGTPTGTFGGALTATASSGALGLNNGGDTVILADTTGAVIDEVVYGGEGGDNQSLTRSPDLTGEFVKSSTVGADYTPGTKSDGTAFDSGDDGTGDDPVLISTIQGSGTASSRVGQTVIVQAVVVGDFQNGDADDARNLGGFFLQEEASDSDGDAATSEGIFVFDGSLGVDVNVGDIVTVTGTVEEFFGMTQIGATGVTVDTPGGVADVNTLAAVVDLDAAAAISDGSGGYVADLEAYEGMLVTIPQTLTVSEMFNFDRFGEIRLTAGGQPSQFTQDNAPDVAGYDAHLQDIYSDSIVYDDGKTVQNPAIPFAAADMNEDGVFNTADPFSMGDTITNATGVLNWAFSEYRMHSIADDANDFVDTDQRDSTPPDLNEDGGRSADLVVASFNVLNFFTTLDENGNVAGPTGLEPRGADNATEYARQFEKLITTLTAMDADILGLVELENEFQSDQNGDGTFAIQAIVDGLNANYGAGTYAYVDPGRTYVDVSDVISVGMIYKTDVVSVSGPAQILDDSVLASLPGSYGDNALFDGANTNRAPLAANFTYDYTDLGGVPATETFTVAVTHMKSKGGTGTAGDADQNDGAGAYNETRTEGVQALTDWLDPTRAGAFADADQIVLGDFNAYAAEDPIGAMTTDGYSDLEQTFNPGSSTYVFDGQTGTLDYAFASASMLDNVTKAAAWHINSPEPDIFDYNTDFGRDTAIFDGSVPYRTSDHDPMLLGINFSDDIFVA